MTDPHVHLVGSVPLSDVETVFSTCAGHLAGVLKRYPDGEASGWASRGVAAFDDVPALERVHPPAAANKVTVGGKVQETPKWRLRPGADADAIAWPATGHAEPALSSYRIFRGLRDDGVIPADARFQVSLPTAYAIPGIHFQAEDIPALLPGSERQVQAELQAILDGIPARDLSIQWDVCVELIFIAERFSPIQADLIGEEAMLNLIARGCDLVPPEAELGLHFCYGNPGGKHLLEPRDTGVMTRLINGLLPRIGRGVTWLHLPVPRDRNDPGYFAPLAELTGTDEVELYLGLVHPEDAMEGGRRRIAAARSALSAFGVATECGLRFYPPNLIPALLDLHRGLAAELNHAG